MYAIHPSGLGTQGGLEESINPRRLGELLLRGKGTLKPRGLRSEGWSRELLMLGVWELGLGIVLQWELLKTTGLLIELRLPILKLIESRGLSYHTHRL